MPSVAQETLEGLQAAIISLTLADVSPANVLIRRAPVVLEDDTLPLVLVSPGLEAFNGAGFNAVDANSFDVFVSLFGVHERTLNADAKFWRACQWREDIERAFQNRRLSEHGATFTSAGQMPCTVTPGEQFIREEFRRGVDAQFLRVRCPVLVNRGAAP